MIAAQDSQASFRLAQSRLQLGIDQRPHHQGVWRFSQCLLAEAETLSLMINAPIATPSPIKVKQMEAPAKPPMAEGQGCLHGGSAVQILPLRHRVQGWQELQMVAFVGWGGGQECKMLDLRGQRPSQVGLQAEESAIQGIQQGGQVRC